MRFLSNSSLEVEGGWILRPVVVSVIVYGALLRILSVHSMGTLRFPMAGEEPAFLARWGSLGTTLTTLNLVFAVLLLRELRLGFGAGAGLRAGHIAAAALGLVYLAGLQWLILEAPEVYGALRG